MINNTFKLESIISIIYLLVYRTYPIDIEQKFERCVICQHNMISPCCLECREFNWTLTIKPSAFNILIFLFNQNFFGVSTLYNVENAILFFSYKGIEIYKGFFWAYRCFVIEI